MVNEFDLLTVFIYLCAGYILNLWSGLHQALLAQLQVKNCDSLNRITENTVFNFKTKMYLIK